MRNMHDVSFVTFVSLAVLVIFAVDSTAAKRGCQSFGHSCYGGHGKRMDSGIGSAPEEVVFGGSNAGGYMPDPQLVFTEPRTGGSNILGAGNMEPEDRQSPLRELHISPFLRQWLQAYRASQDFRQNNM